MGKTSAITLRVPPSIKKALRVRAESSHRSLSAEALSVIEGSLRGDTPAGPGRFLGMFAGSRLPTDEEIRAVRRELWGGLGRRKP